MYLEHFKLNLKPFQITSDPRFLWLGEKHKEALATLRYGIVDNRGFLLLTGEVGTGKTILINRLVSLLNIDTVVATLTDPDLESMDFYNLLADGFKMERTFDSKGAFLIHLRDFLHQSYSKQQQVLLIIDESQRLNHRLMEDIRVLSNIELHDRKLINIFFVGQQEFNSILMTSQNRALAQRITVRYHIEPLDEDETRQYIEHRLKVAGTTRQIFNRSALKEIYQFSGGIPRLINIISDHALLTGYSRGAKQINDIIVKECAEDLRIPVKRQLSDRNKKGKPVKILNTAPIPDGTVKKSKEPPSPIEEKLTEEKFTDGQPNDFMREESSYQEKKASSWKIAYAAMVVVLIGIVAFTITHFTSNDQPRWDTEELTPSKYKDTLEKETEILSNQLNDPKFRQNANIPDNTKKRAEDTQKKPKTSPSTTVDKSKDIRSETPAPTKGSDSAETLTAHSGIGEIDPLPLIKEDLIIYFDINSNEIDGQSYPLLDRIAYYLVRHSEEKINVRGYTDSSGSEGYNESVSMFRANNVKSYLIGKGVEPENIKIFAMGAQNPIASNDSFEGRRKNRRVEIEFLQENGGGN